MRWLRQWQFHRAAKRYGLRLGAHLQRAYGAAEHYSPPQIRAGVAKLGLNPSYIVLGYAAFLPEEAFVSLAKSMPVYLPYQEARETFVRYRPTRLTSASANPETSINVTTAC